MESEWTDQIAEIEQRARNVNMALNQLCVAAGVRQNNLTRWKQGRSPSFRVFSRDVSKLERTLADLELDMAMRLIERINPDAAPRIAEMLKASAASGAYGQVGQSEADAERASASEPEGHRENDAPTRRRHGGRAA